MYRRIAYISYMVCLVYRGDMTYIPVGLDSQQGANNTNSFDSHAEWYRYMNS